MTDALHPAHVARPPRHKDNSELCVTALITLNCPENHYYSPDEPMTPLEQRVVALEVMVEELALLDPESGAEVAGYTYEVDEVARDESGRIVTIFGTRSRFKYEPITNEGRVMHPYILGEV